MGCNGVHCARSAKQMLGQRLQGPIFNKFHERGEVALVRFFRGGGVLFVKSLKDLADGSGFVDQDVDRLMSEDLVPIFYQCRHIRIECVSQLADGIVWASQPLAIPMK